MCTQRVHHGVYGGLVVLNVWIALSISLYRIFTFSNREVLLFAAVRRIAANRCFHGSPVFDSFYGDASTIRAGFC